MYGLTWKLKGIKKIKYFMSQDSMNRFIAMLRLSIDNAEMKVLPNERMTIFN